MYVEKLNEMCDATSVAASAGTALVGDVIDLGGVTNYIGTGEPIYAVVHVDTEIITAGNAGTIQFKLASDAQAAIATDGSATDHITSASIVTDGTDANGALCKAGATPICARIPSGAYERYLGILVVTGTTTTTAGKINAFLTHDVSKWVAMPDALA